MIVAVSIVCVTLLALQMLRMWERRMDSETSKRAEEVAKKVADFDEQLTRIDARATFAVDEFKAAEQRIYEHERKLIQAQQQGRGLSTRV